MVSYSLNLIYINHCVHFDYPDFILTVFVKFYIMQNLFYCKTCWLHDNCCYSIDIVTILRSVPGIQMVVSPETQFWMLEICEHVETPLNVQNMIPSPSESVPVI